MWVRLAAFSSLAALPLPYRRLFLFGHAILSGVAGMVILTRGKCVWVGCDALVGIDAASLACFPDSYE